MIKKYTLGEIAEAFSALPAEYKSLEYMTMSIGIFEGCIFVSEASVKPMIFDGKQWRQFMGENDNAL